MRGLSWSLLIFFSRNDIDVFKEFYTNQGSKLMGRIRKKGTFVATMQYKVFFAWNPRLVLVGFLMRISMVLRKQKRLRIKHKRVTFSIEAPVISLVFMSEMLRNYNKMISHQYSIPPRFSAFLTLTKKSAFFPCGQRSYLCTVFKFIYDKKSVIITYLQRLSLSLCAPAMNKQSCEPKWNCRMQNMPSVF